MTYDYDCPDCGAKHTIRCRLNDADLQTCSCGSLLRRVRVYQVNVGRLGFGTLSECDKPGMPKSREEWRAWDEQGVRHMRPGEMDDLEERARAAERECTNA